MKGTNQMEQKQVTSDSLVYTVEEVARRFKISRNKAYEAIAKGEIPCIRFGRKVVIPKLAVQKLLETIASKGGNHE